MPPASQQELEYEAWKRKKPLVKPGDEMPRMQIFKTLQEVIPET